MALIGCLNLNQRRRRLRRAPALAWHGHQKLIVFPLIIHTLHALVILLNYLLIYSFILYSFILHSFFISQQMKAYSGKHPRVATQQGVFYSGFPSNAMKSGRKEGDTRPSTREYFRPEGMRTCLVREGGNVRNAARTFIPTWLPWLA